MTGIESGSDLVLSVARCMPSVGTASIASAPADTASVRAGCRSDGRSTRPHSRDSPRPAVNRHSSGTRGRSIARPNATSIAGSTVSEPSTATATTMIDPVAKERNTTLPVPRIPAARLIKRSSRITRSSRDGRRPW